MRLVRPRLVTRRQSPRLRRRRHLRDQPRRIWSSASPDRAPRRQALAIVVSDGTQIAFASRLGPYEPWSVCVVRPDGTHRRLLATGTAAPAWSPDGTRIAVTSRCVGIKLLRPAGQDVTPGRASCRTIGVSGTPVWSPDGTQIAVVGHPQGTASGVYVMNADGTDLRLLTRATSSRGASAAPTPPGSLAANLGESVLPAGDEVRAAHPRRHPGTLAPIRPLG